MVALLAQRSGEMLFVSAGRQHECVCSQTRMHVAFAHLPRDDCCSHGICDDVGAHEGSRAQAWQTLALGAAFAGACMQNTLQAFADVWMFMTTHIGGKYT